MDSNIQTNGDNRLYRIDHIENSRRCNIEREERRKNELRKNTTRTKNP